MSALHGWQERVTFESVLKSESNQNKFSTTKTIIQKFEEVRKVSSLGKLVLDAVSREHNALNDHRGLNE